MNKTIKEYKEKAKQNNTSYYAEVALEVMNKKCSYFIPTFEQDITKEIAKILNEDQEDCRSLSFRWINKFFDDRLNNYRKTKINGRNVWYKSHININHFEQHYNKEQINIFIEAIKWLKEQNHKNNYVLAGSNNTEIKILGKNKTILVDFNKNFNADLYTNIQNIKEKAGYSLDYCSILTKNKIKHINSLPSCSSIVLEFQTSKYDRLIYNLDKHITRKYFGSYIGKSNKRMKIYTIKVL